MYTVVSLNKFCELRLRLRIHLLSHISYNNNFQFSVPQIEYPLRGSSKKGSHVYFQLIVAVVLPLWRLIVLLWHQVTMLTSKQHLYQTIVLPRQLATGSIHDYLFCYCPLEGILLEVLRISLSLKEKKMKKKFQTNGPRRPPLRQNNVTGIGVTLLYSIQADPYMS